MKELIRSCRFSPYRPGQGPRFVLKVYDLNRYRDNKACLGYCLTQTEKGSKPVILFEAEDFCASPCHAIDSDETIAALMGFLTLKPGDTDREYFENYSPLQMDYCQAHAEALGAEVYFRFGDC